MQTRRTCQAAGAAFLAIGVLAVWEARHLDYYTSLGPGPGLLPLWLGFTMMGLAALWFWQVSLRPLEQPPGGMFPDRHGQIRILSILSALIVSIVMLDVAGPVFHTRGSRYRTEQAVRFFEGQLFHSAHNLLELPVITNPLVAEPSLRLR